jgi:hypothetical protein
MRIKQMKLKFILIALVFFVVGGNAHATLIKGSNFTSLTETRLDWLDRIETSNLTWTKVNLQLSSGGVLDGWRIAHTTEIIALLYAFGSGGSSTYYLGASTTNNGLLEALAPYWGVCIA